MRQTKEEFVEKAIKKHGEWYDYSKVEYVNAYTKVCIICPIHGEFWQTPHSHLSGSGCPHCGEIKRAKSRTKSQEQLIKEFREVHDDFYDYSKVEYINSYTKVLIICPDHGEFWQKPNDHLSGCGCPHCVGLVKLTKEEFVERSILVHGDWYDYNKVEYVNNRIKVLIICPDHGEFWQKPNKHLSGQGCPHCGDKKLTKEEFVERSILVHGDWYDYSKVEYVNNRIKVCIICPIHGEFWQTPANHLSGYGCPHCANDKLKLGKNIFVERSIEKHGVFYDYSKVEYINSKTKVLIICPIHGEFWQTPGDHLSGSGCPYCRASKLETNVNKILTNNNINFLQNYKGFDWLKNISRLELDFYLPEYNIGIECQGRQHFESVEYFGGKEYLEYIQNNDILKKQLCEEHGLKLFYINYDDNIEKKMEDIICCHIGKYLEQNREKSSGDLVT
jgi:glutaredoxin